MIRLLREYKHVIRDRVAKHKGFKQHEYFISLVQDGKALPGNNMDWMLAQANHIFVGRLDPNTKLFWSAIMFLAQQPEKYKKFANEIRGKSKWYEDIEEEQLVHLLSLSGIIEHSLRLYTNGSFRQMRISSGATVDGHYLPAGVGVQISIFSAFHSEYYWHKPRSFCPERWIPPTDPDHDPVIAKGVRECSWPFIAGTRSCIVQNMGYRQARAAG